MTQTKVDYHQYLASREWRLKRKEVIERCGNVCERCHQGPVQNVHHLTYERVGNELIADLQGLCRPCHEFMSGEQHDDPAKKSLSLDVKECPYCGDILYVMGAEFLPETDREKHWSNATERAEVRMHCMTGHVFALVVETIELDTKMLWERRSNWHNDEEVLREYK